MRIVLATGIYPPDFGGPATYVRALAGVLRSAGDDVTVIAYAPQDSSERLPQDPWTVIRVPRSGGPIVRWLRYAKALRSASRGADVIEAFSSVSCGIPLYLSRVRGAKRVLRLGGEFFWERYTDNGGRLPLSEWMRQGGVHHRIMGLLLGTFDHVVFSTQFQRDLTIAAHPKLPPSSVIENALPEGSPHRHHLHAPLRLLFLGRFVRFKNLEHLLLALCRMQDATLTFAGDGPCKPALQSLAATLHLSGRVQFLPPVDGKGRDELFAEHDMLVLPSLTEISPNTALEARAVGLPVLLTANTGLSERLSGGMLLRRLIDPSHIAMSIEEVRTRYNELAEEAARPPSHRSWGEVSADHRKLFANLTQP